MKFTLTRTIGLDDASMTGELMPGAALGIFQDAALAHCAREGFPFRWFQDRGFAWVLAEIECRFHAPVMLDETIEITTWSRGIEGVRGYREFSVTRDGERVASASSLWIHVDVNRHRPARVPKELSGGFVPEPELAIKEASAISAPEARGDGRESVVGISFRDIDVYGHVNNSAYAAMIQTALWREFGLRAGFDAFRIIYKKEIPGSAPNVTVALRRNGRDFGFEVRGETVHAEGWFRLGEERALGLG